MKTLLCALKILILFCALSGSFSVIAQEPIRNVSVSVTDAQNSLLNAEVVFKLKREPRYSQTVYSNTEGRSQAYLYTGIYDIFVIGVCVTSKQENIEIDNDKKTLLLDLKLPDVSCGTAQTDEESDWKICEQETATKEFETADTDRAELVNQSLSHFLEIETARKTAFFQDGKIDFSNDNINPEWINPANNLLINFFTFSKLQDKAKKTKLGVTSYWRFNQLKAVNNCAFIVLTTGNVVRPKSRVFFCGNVPQITYLYRKINGRWILKAERHDN